MKKNLFFGLACVCLFSSTTFSQNLFIEVPKTSTAITIDGDMEAAWEEATTITVDNWGDEAPPTESDFTASFKLIWDDNYVYFLGMIADDILMDQAACSDAAIVDWEVDNWEIYWSPGNSFLDDMSRMTQVRLAYANATSEDPTSTTTNGWSEDGFTIGNFVSAIKLETGDGYIIEASFDLNVSATAAAKDNIGLGDTIGFNAAACDNDGEATRDNVGGIIDSFEYNQTDTLLRLVLVEELSSNITDYQESNIRIYPTLITNQIRFSNSTEIASVEIINLQGQILFSKVRPSGSVDVNRLPSGIYMVRINTTKGTDLNQKIIKH